MKKRWLLVLPLVALLAAPAVLSATDAPVAVSRAPAAARQVEGVVVDAYDGDTLTLRLDGGKTEKVRLLGIDTAEMAQGPWGVKARDFLRSLVLKKRVRVAFDVQERDRYGRLLGYVYLADGTFVNHVLVRRGYAMVLTYPPNVAHVEAFTAAQTAARQEKLNIWGPDGLAQTPREFRRHGKPAGVTRGTGMQVLQAPKGGEVRLNTRSKKYHRPDCRHADCANCEPVTEAEARKAGGEPAGCCH